MAKRRMKTIDEMNDQVNRIESLRRQLAQRGIDKSTLVDKADKAYDNYAQRIWNSKKAQEARMKAESEYIGRSSAPYTTEEQASAVTAGIRAARNVKMTRRQYMGLAQG